MINIFYYKTVAVDIVDNKDKLVAAVVVVVVLQVAAVHTEEEPWAYTTSV